MSKIIENFQNLGTTRLTILAAVGTTVIAAIALIVGLMARSETALLYAGLDRAAFEGVVAELRRLNVPFDANPEDGAVEVNSDDVARLRMSLAAQGLPAPSTTGYELFEKQGTFGLTSFMQRINWTRALEGELSRTIQTLNGIRSARVHLVLPNREDFARDAQKASASVVVDTIKSGNISPGQASAVRHLVATAVPSLDATAVTVMDTDGNVMAAEGDGFDQIAQRANDLQAAYENRVKQRIEDLLVPRVGPGNVRVSVAAEMDFAREAVREETFDPKSRVLRSVQTVEESERSKEEGGEQPVTVGQNIPLEENVAGAEDGNVLHESAREEETNNYEINSVTRERVREAGELKRLSVAVMVNGDPISGENGDITIEPRSAEELQRIEALVKSAIGYSASRGDTVTVDSMEFVDSVSLFAPGQPEGVVAVLARQMSAIVQWLVLLVALIFLVQVILRPMLSRLLAEHQGAKGQGALAHADGVGGYEQLEDGTPVSGRMADGLDPSRALPGAQTDDEGTFPALPGADYEGDGTGLIAGEGDNDVSSLIEAVSASSVKRLKSTVDRHPDEAVAILRSWMYEEVS